MKISILGGGLTGLSAAYHLSKAGHSVALYEAAPALGGLAGSFRREGWGWGLERTYHHIFSNDDAILGLAREIGYGGFTFSAPLTASLFGSSHNYRIFPVDSPYDFIRLPELSLWSKLRAGMTVVLLKLSPFLTFYEKITAKSLLKKAMGEEVWSVMWEQLFRKKFGKYADNILASFIWARIAKRTQSLGYPSGGFQDFIDFLAAKIRKNGVAIHTGTMVSEVRKKEGGYEVVGSGGEGEFANGADIVISTLPYPVTTKVMRKLLGKEYCAVQNKRQYLFAVNLIVKTKRPILDKVYWLNIGARDVPFMCMVEHTNFVSPSHYGNGHISYIAWYVDGDSDLLRKNETELLAFVLPHLKNISPGMEETPEIVALFKAPYAQPIYDSAFLAIPRSFDTPLPHVYVANLDMTYPYDRGTNYAVQLGKDVTNYIIKHL